MPKANGPYSVQRVEGAKGPAWRIVGPGMAEGKSYPWEGVREKLEGIAEVMNFAWRQCEKQVRATTRSPK